MSALKLPPHKTREEFLEQFGGRVPWPRPQDLALLPNADIVGYVSASVSVSSNDRRMFDRFGRSQIMCGRAPDLYAEIEFLVMDDGVFMKMVADWRGTNEAPSRGEWIGRAITPIEGEPTMDLSEVRADVAAFDAAVEEIERA